MYLALFMVELKMSANNEWTNALDLFVVQILNAHNLLIGLLAGRYIGRFFYYKSSCCSQSFFEQERLGILLVGKLYIDRSKYQSDHILTRSKQSGDVI